MMTTSGIGEESRALSPQALGEVVAALISAGVDEVGAGDLCVFGSDPALARCVQRLMADLVPFGLRVVPVMQDRPDALVVSGHRPGLPAAWAETELDDLIEDVRAERLTHWAASAHPPATLRTIHRPGSDSIGVVEFDSPLGPLVAKTGPIEVMATEEEHVRRTTATGAAVFPTPRSYEARDGLATRVMAAAKDADFGERLFIRSPDGLLRADPSAMSLLDEHLAALSRWYASTVTEGEPRVGRYLYVGRFGSLPASTAFREVGERVLGEVGYRVALEREVVLGDDAPTTFVELVGWLEETYWQWAPRSSAEIHGDLGTSNLMYALDGSASFIDPRTVWDGVAAAEDGRGDPMFDFGTLLHSVSPMVAVLDACRRGEDTLLCPSGVPETGPFDARGSIITEDDPARRIYLDRVVALSSGWADSEAMVRLHVASACSLLGWLKYGKIVRTPDAWWTVFGAVIADLDRARKAHRRGALGRHNDEQDGRNP